MKKITLLSLACCIAIASFAAGGNITYELNGGVTNPDGWKNKNDMYMGLNQSWNTFSATNSTWTPLDTLIKNHGSAEAAVPKGIPTEAGSMAPTFAQDETVKAKWQWLFDYMDAVCVAQEKGKASAGGAAFRYNLSAFFLSSVRKSWPYTPDYAIAGQPEAFMSAWKQGFKGPDSYDGTVEVLLPAPYQEGKTFDGWYAAADFSGERITSIAAGESGDKTFYAKWVEYIPTCAEVGALAAGTATKAQGAVTYVNGTVAYVQDASGGLMIEFATAPELAKGDNVLLSGTTEAVGTYIKVTGATVITKNDGELPTIQTLLLETLKAKAGLYMFEYVFLEGLKITAHEAGLVTLVDNAGNTIKLSANLDPTTFPVNLKVNVKGIVSFDSEVILVAEALNVTPSPVPRPDPFNYPARKEGKYTLKSKWMISSVLDNLSANMIGAVNHVRGMTAKDGKMYFVDRQLKQLTVIDGATGDRLAPIKLSDDMFKHTYKDKDGNDSIGNAGGLHFNDIKQDAEGNILISNCITTNGQAFQVWKVDLATGNGTLIVDEVLKENVDFATANIRFDAFGVYGNVDADALIMATNAMAPDVYFWEISNGNAEAASRIELKTATPGTGITNITPVNWAPQTYPISNDLFYIDYSGTLPTLIDMQGTVADGFYDFTKEGAPNPAIIDSITKPDTHIKLNPGPNGLAEFEMAGEHFLVIGATNTDGSPKSTFRLFKFADANKKFKDIEVLWTFPADGLGGNSNQYRTAMPVVSVDETAKVATIYFYYGENGYGVYEFKIGDGNSVDKVNDEALRINIIGNTLNFDKNLTKVAVYSIAGQLQVEAKHANFVNVAEKGIYIVKATTEEGKNVVRKVIVK